MADFATVARPYARAAFEYAQAREQIKPWREFLDALAQASALAPVQDLIAAPMVPRAMRAQVLAQVVGVTVPDGGDNFLHLLADNGRLAALPAVAEEFARVEDEMEATAEVVIETAVELGQDSSQRLVASLGKRLGRELEARFQVTPEIIGGIVVRIGDEVIDASLATRLARLTSAMAS